MKLPPFGEAFSVGFVVQVCYDLSMTTNAHTITCTDCLRVARETVLEGMAENIMDDHDVDYDVAVAMIESQAIDLAEGINDFFDNDNLRRNGTCSMLHAAWY